MIDYYMVGNQDSLDRPNVEKAIDAYIEPLINADVTFHIIGFNDWVSKSETALEAGQKMDVFFTADWEDYSKEVNEKLLLPLNDDKGANGNLLKQYGKDITSSLNPAYITGTQINGVNYAVPTNKELSVPWGFVYNMDVANTIGFTPADAAAIKTIDDLEPWLVKAKAAGVQYPYDTDGTIAFMQWQHGFTNLSDYIVNMSSISDASGKVDETILDPMETPWMTPYLNTIRKYYTAGYIDPNSALTTYDMMQDLNAGKFFVAVQPLKGNGAKSGELMEASGNSTLKLGEIYCEPKVVNTSDTGGSMLAIPVTSGNPVVAMEFINLMHSDSTLINMMLYGVPTTDWTVDPDGRVTVVSGNSWVTAIAGAWVMGDITLQKVTNKEDPKKNQLLIDYAKDAVPMPDLGFRFDQTPVAAQVTAITTVVTTDQRALLTGSVDPATALPKYISDLKAAGLDTITTEVQKQYAAWKAASGK
jgi:putative aldouronate transport system substrate-binding protein